MTWEREGSQSPTTRIRFRTRKRLTDSLGGLVHRGDGEPQAACVDGVGEAVALVDDLAVAPAVEELGRELRGRQDPVGRLGERRVGVDGRELLALFEELLESWKERASVELDRHAELNGPKRWRSTPRPSAASPASLMCAAPALWRRVSRSRSCSSARAVSRALYGPGAGNSVRYAPGLPSPCTIPTPRRSRS